MSGTTGKVSIEHLPLLCLKLRELNAEWEQFGIALHVKFDTLQQIKSNPERSSVRNKMTSVLNEWRKGEGVKTWRVIYDAVKKLNNIALAERIQQLHDLDSTVNTDQDDYIDNMLTTLRGVIPQYNAFGLHIGLDPNVLQEIDGDRLTAETCMRNLVVIWISEKGDKATICEIIEACRRMKNYSLAEKLKNDSEINKTFGMNGEPPIQKQQRVKSVISKGLGEDYKPQLPKESNTGKTERRKENIAQQPDISEQQSTSHTGENEEPNSVSLCNMELIAKYHTEFSSDKPLSVDWDIYGCRLQIPEGSIPQGEIGTLDIHAIYSGPFQFPEDSSPVSAYYFISLSHNLQKPATLELQHSYIINSDDDAAQLTFASATASTGPPYHFRPVDGGSFLQRKYAVIHQTNFSIYTILVTHVRAIGQSISRWFNSVQYALSYFLIVQHPKMWIVKLFISKYSNAHIEHLKQQERSEKPVNYNYFLFVLEDGVDTVSTLVVPEEDSITDLEVKREEWKSDKKVVIKKWEVRSAVTEVFVVSEPPPCIQFYIEWIDELPAERCVFHIHLLGVIQDIRIPVSVPFPIEESGSMSCLKEKQLTSADFPDLLRATKELSDWFTLGIFLKVEYSKLKTLKRDYPSDHNHCRQEMLMLWISSGNATWSILVKTLRDDMNEPGLAERIEKTYIQY